MNENPNKWSGENPWLGLGSYNEGQKLYGRDLETAELTDIILNHTAIVVYGKSGIGKSSLLRAGVFPRLREQDYIPIYVRLEHNSDIGYTQQIENAVSEHVTLHDQLPTEIPDLGLWDFMHRHRFTDTTGHVVTPVIVLDQFEEIFTLTQVEHKSDIQQFFSQLADLLNDVKPNGVIEAEANYANRHSDTRPEAPHSGISLRIQSVAKLNYDKSPSFRFVFSIRDDSLYLLERNSAKIPALKVNRFNLNALDEENALQVIMNPRPGLFTQAEGQKILDELAYYEYDDFRVVDPAILSLFLYSYYQEQGKVSSTDIFELYYNKCISRIKPEHLEIIENLLITARGNRIQIPTDDLGASGVSSESIEFLVHNKILRIERRKGVDYVEFMHDRLCEQAMKRRSQRRKKVQDRKDFKFGLSCLSCIVFIGLFLISMVLYYAINEMNQEEQNERNEVALEDRTHWTNDDYENYIFELTHTIHKIQDSIAGIAPIELSFENNDSTPWAISQYEEYIQTLKDSINTLRYRDGYNTNLIDLSTDTLKTNQ